MCYRDPAIAGMADDSHFKFNSQAARARIIIPDMLTLHDSMLDCIVLCKRKIKYKKIGVLLRRRNFHFFMARAYNSERDFIR